MKLVFIFSLITFSAHAEMTEKFIVTKLRFDSEKKIYKIDFKNQAGVYKAPKILFPCLEKSLTEKKEVKVAFDPMKLVLSSCKSSAESM